MLRRFASAQLSCGTAARFGKGMGAAVPKVLPLPLPAHRVPESLVPIPKTTLRPFSYGFREFFLELNGHWPDDPAPISIILVGSEKEHATYRLNDSAAAFFGLSK
jgi:hypothetical protein